MNGTLSLERNDSKTNSRVQFLNERDRTKKIMKWIKWREKKIRSKHSWLQNQNSIGAFITFSSALAMIGVAVLYYFQVIPFWVAIPVSAIFASFLHEMEHDLIHNLYFKENLKMQNALFWMVWAFRGNTISPWYRREIHLLHHKESGHRGDIEERLIGNGMGFGWKRILTMIDGNMSFLINSGILSKEAKGYSRARLVKESWPFLVIFYHLWYTFLILNVLFFANTLLPNPIEIPNFAIQIKAFFDFAAVVYCIPNFLRQSSIQIISSNMHYFDDVKGLYDQTQILTPWFLAPLQLFCFNFGSTHGIHHYVVMQPFYLRQWVSPYVQKALLKYGMRKNDLGTFFRRNSYELTKSFAK